MPPSRLMALLGQVSLEKYVSSYVFRLFLHKTSYDVVESLNCIEVKFKCDIVKKRFPMWQGFNSCRKKSPL